VIYESDGVIYESDGVICGHRGVICGHHGVICDHHGVICDHHGVICDHHGVICGYHHGDDVHLLWPRCGDRLRRYQLPYVQEVRSLSLYIIVIKKNIYIMKDN
jgi:hypothetical protein